MVFCLVEYEGNFQNIFNFLKEKLPSAEVSQSNTKKVLVKLPNEEDKDELIFLSNFTMEDGITNIFSVKYFNIIKINYQIRLRKSKNKNTKHIQST